MGISFDLLDHQWVGEYNFNHTRIWDSARRLEPVMYRQGQMQCLSFGNSKPMQLGRCGAILLDDKNAYDAISEMRSDGRNLKSRFNWGEQAEYRAGYHYCPSLEICGLGIEKLETHIPQSQEIGYPDCRNITFTK